MTITRINPETLPDAGALGYSQITVCTPGDLVFISGQVAWTRDGDPVPEDLTSQAGIASENLIKALHAANSTPAHITSLRVYLVGQAGEAMAEAAPVLMSVLGDQQPSITVIGVTSLATPELKIEIEATAVVATA